MGQSRTDRANALADADERLSNHLVVEEPVKSFRLCNFVKRLKADVDQSAYPFGRARPTVEKASFAYTSTYAYCLTWTPGYMTIVGDIGELTLVHYNAMGNFEKSLDFIISSSLDYLIEKTNRARVYDKNETEARFWRHLSEPVIEALLGYGAYFDGRHQRRADWCSRSERQAWRRQQPRGGQLNEEEENVLEWFDARPHTSFDDIEADEWHHWRQLVKNRGSSLNHCNVTVAKDRRAFKRHYMADAFNSAQHAYDAFIDAEIDDPPIAYNYGYHDWFQLSAMQHGCREIQKFINKKEER